MKRIIKTVVLLTLFFQCEAVLATDNLGKVMEANFQIFLSALQKEDSDEEHIALYAAREFIDFKTITRGVISKQHASALSKAQIDRFQLEFEQSMIQLLRKLVASLDDVQVVVKDVNKRNDTRAQVLAVIEIDSGERFELLSSIVWIDERWKVRNIIANGVNLGVTYRNQFNELMKTHGGDGAAVIAAWSESLTLPN